MNKLLSLEQKFETERQPSAVSNPARALGCAARILLACVCLGRGLEWLRIGRSRFGGRRAQSAPVRRRRTIAFLDFP